MFNYKFLTLTIVYASGILWFSFQPDYSATAAPNILRQAVLNFLHIPAYAGLAGLMMLTAKRAGIKDEGLRMKGKERTLSFNLYFLFFVFIIATLYGVLNEFIQADVPGRFFSVGDMLRNAVGAGIGIWIIKGLRIRHQG